MLKALRVELRNTTLRFVVLPERGNENIKISFPRVEVKPTAVPFSNENNNYYLSLLIYSFCKLYKVLPTPYIKLSNRKK